MKRSTRRLHLEVLEARTVMSAGALGGFFATHSAPRDWHNGPHSPGSFDAHRPGAYEAPSGRGFYPNSNSGDYRYSSYDRFGGGLGDRHRGPDRGEGERGTTVPLPPRPVPPTSRPTLPGPISPGPIFPGASVPGGSIPNESPPQTPAPGRGSSTIPPSSLPVSLPGRTSPPVSLPNTNLPSGLPGSGLDELTTGLETPSTGRANSGRSADVQARWNLLTDLVFAEASLDFRRTNEAKSASFNDSVEEIGQLTTTDIGLTARLAASRRTSADIDSYPGSKATVNGQKSEILPTGNESEHSERVAVAARFEVFASAENGFAARPASDRRETSSLVRPLTWSPTSRSPSASPPVNDLAGEMVDISDWAYGEVRSSIGQELGSHIVAGDSELAPNMSRFQAFELAGTSVPQFESVDGPAGLRRAAGHDGEGSPGAWFLRGHSDAESALRGLSVVVLGVLLFRADARQTLVSFVTKAARSVATSTAGAATSTRKKLSDLSRSFIPSIAWIMRRRR